MVTRLAMVVLILLAAGSACARAHGIAASGHTQGQRRGSLRVAPGHAV